MSYNDKKIFFNPEKDGSVDEREQIICTSSSEDEEVKRKLREGGYSTVEAAGAGYKLLMVILGHAQAYILSKPTTYKWDTCGPHALLSSLGGGIVDYRCALAAQSPHACQIKYYQNDTQCNDSVSINRWCNQGGIIAYRDQRILTKLLQLLSS